MKIAKLLNNKYAIRLEKGEKIMASLEDFAKKHSSEIGFAQFSMIGAVEGTDTDPILIYLSEHGDKGGHTERKISGKMELLPSWGNIAWDHDEQVKPVVHCHVNLGEGEDKETSRLLQGHGGHLGEATISLTAEVILEVLSREKFTRKMDEEVQLELWNFPPNYLELEDNSDEKELEKLKQEKRELEMKLKILDNNYQSLQATTSEEKTRLEVEIEELNKKLTDLQAQAGTDNEENQNLQAELEKKQAEVKELENKITSLETTHKELKKQVKDLEDKLEEATEGKEELQSQLDQTKEKLVTCEKDLKEAKEQRRDLITQIDQMQTTLTNINNSKNDEADKYRKQLTEALVKQKELEGKIRELESSIGSSNNNEAEIQRLKDELSKWTSKFPDQTPEQINFPALLLDQTALSQSRDFLTNYVKLLKKNIDDNNRTIAETNNESAKQSFQQDNVDYKEAKAVIEQFAAKWYK